MKNKTLFTIILILTVSLSYAGDITPQTGTPPMTDEEAKNMNSDEAIKQFVEMYQKQIDQNQASKKSPEQKLRATCLYYHDLQVKYDAILSRQRVPMTVRQTQDRNGLIQMNKQCSDAIQYLNRHPLGDNQPHK